MIYRGLEPVVPNEKEIKQARQLRRVLSKNTAKKAKSIDIVLKEDKTKTGIITLSSSASRLLVAALTQIAEGNAVAILPLYAELTTQEAADVLRVSRPFLIKLLETKKIPFRKVGTRRKVLLKDLMLYKTKNDEARRKVLDELAQEAQELGLY